jgi:hypothetical protein
MVNDPLPLGDVLKFRADEREAILAYGRALIREKATAAAILVWRELEGRCRERMEHMHSADAERLRGVLHGAEWAATVEHVSDCAELHRCRSVFDVTQEKKSELVGR